MMLAKPMTIGQLSRRTGVPIKALREYEQLGLIYTLGRSESNYRLFDEEALWCVQVICAMRSLGLTLKEIQDLADVYLERPGEPIGPHIGEKLEAALQSSPRKRLGVPMYHHSRSWRGGRRTRSEYVGRYHSSSSYALRSRGDCRPLARTGQE
jgi:DNA-binding transcriptional MerR regulator